MKVLTRYPLYRRLQPSNLFEANGFLPAGTELEVGAIVEGTPIDGVSTWIKATDGFYYWEGGIQSASNAQLALSAAEGFAAEYRLPEFWQKGFDGSGIRIGIIDLCFDPASEAMKGMRITKVLNLDGNQHGAHGNYMACIAGGNNMAQRLMGVAPGATFSLVGIGDSGFQPFLQAIELLGDVHIISVSLSSKHADFSKDENKDAVAAALARKPNLIAFLASAGNNRNTNATAVYPANYPEVTPVGGFDQNDGTKLDKSSNFLQARRNEHYVHHFLGYFNHLSRNAFDVVFPGAGSPHGTSSATAFLAGLLAIISGAEKRKNPTADIRKKIGTYFLTKTFSFIDQQTDLQKTANALAFNNTQFFTILNTPL